MGTLEICMYIMLFGPWWNQQGSRRGNNNIFICTSWLHQQVLPMWIYGWGLVVQEPVWGLVNCLCFSLTEMMVKVWIPHCDHILRYHHLSQCHSVMIDPGRGKHKLKGAFKDKGSWRASSRTREIVGLPQWLLVADRYLGSSQWWDKECALKSSTTT